MQARERARRLTVKIVSDEYLDLYILGAAALIFTILGFAGVAGVKLLASVTLALLAVLAFSQIRSRRHVAEIARTQSWDPLSIFQTSFPDDLDGRRGSASSLLLIGVSLIRTVQAGSLTALREVLTSGGRIRVLVLDPTDDALVRAASDRRPDIPADRVKRRIESALDELADLKAATGGDVQIRVARFVPTMCINAIDVGSPDGLIVLQHYEYKPAREHAPIFTLRPADGYWYHHFADEAERLWNDGMSWPPPPAELLRRSARPLFQDEFGPELELSMDKAREMVITGVTRNGLLSTNYSKFEAWLKQGCSIRFLLIEPSADAVAVAADRYYAERSAESPRGHIHQTLRLLAELKRSTGGDLSVRLTDHPLAMGMIAIDASPGRRTDSTALFAEYYTYRTWGKPKFVLQPADGHWFDDLYLEAEALWAGAADHSLDSAP